MNDRTAVMRPQPNSLTITWLALGLTLTMAPRFRIGLYFPIGPGEVISVLWILWVIWNHVFVAGRLPGRQARISTILGIVALFIFLAGILSALLLGFSNYTSWRDFFALVFVIVLAFAFNLHFTDRASLERFYLTLIAFLSIYVFPLFIVSRFTSHIGPFSLYYDVGLTRFSALAFRPGQLDFIFVAIPFLSIHFLFRRKGILTRASLLLLCVASLYLGFDHKSDSFLVGVAAGSVVALILIWGKAASLLNRRNRLAGIGVVAASLIVLSLISSLMFDKVESWAMNIYEERGQGSVRINLWINGLKAASMSPVFGLGPGSYSGVKGPFQHSEAHNTLIDVTTVGGMLGALVFLCVIGYLGWRTLMTGLTWLNAGFFSMIGYSFFHYTLRQPLYLIGLIMIHKLASSLSNSSVRCSPDATLDHR